MSLSLNQFISLHGVIFTPKLLLSLIFSKNYNQTDNGNIPPRRFVYMLFIFAADQVHKLVRLWSSISAAVLYVIIYQLDLRNIKIKTINLLHYSIHILILKYVNLRDKSGCFFALLREWHKLFACLYNTRFRGKIACRSIRVFRICFVKDPAYSTGSAENLYKW